MATESTYFDPNGAAINNSGLFGLPCNIKDSQVIIIPVPWDATSSHSHGTSTGTKAVLKESKFVELYSKNLGNFFEKGIAMEEMPLDIIKKNRKARRLAAPIVDAGNTEQSKRLKSFAEEVDVLCEEMNNHVYAQTRKHLKNNKTVGLLGGDHSISFGSIRAHIEKYPNMGVLQFDAHYDLRDKFEGLTYSHGSIMNNVIEKTSLIKLTQVGIRGYCEEEYNKSIQSNERIITFLEDDIVKVFSEGESWASICNRIIQTLPNEVYVSFDIDSLEPSLCPNTGTPVPGGLTYQQVMYLLNQIVCSGRIVVGFDLVEISSSKNDNTDAIVGAHLLYKLSGFTLCSCRSSMSNYSNKSNKYKSHKNSKKPYYC